MPTILDMYYEHGFEIAQATSLDAPGWPLHDAR